MTQTEDKPSISPDLGILAMLNAYPELEDVLIDIAPAFKKLRNPVLRRTVARLSTLRQAAVIAGIPVGDLINRLRVAVGHEEAWEGDDEEDKESTPRPDWIDECTVYEIHDAREEIEDGGQPLTKVMSITSELEKNQMLVLRTPFKPAPMIDKLTELGFRSWTERKSADHFVTYFARR